MLNQLQTAKKIKKTRAFLTVLDVRLSSYSPQFLADCFCLSVCVCFSLSLIKALNLVARRTAGPLIGVGHWSID